MFDKEILKELAEQVATDAALEYVKEFFIGQEEYNKLKQHIAKAIVFAFDGYADQN